MAMELTQNQIANILLADKIFSCFKQYLTIALNHKSTVSLPRSLFSTLKHLTNMWVYMIFMYSVNINVNPVTNFMEIKSTGLETS